MSDLSQSTARRIIEVVHTNGQPPEYGCQYFTVGLDQYLKTLDTEYLSSLIRDGASSFRLVVGGYGGGKTHFLYCVRDAAWKNGYVVSYVSLGGEEARFHKWEQIYRAVARGIIPPVTQEELLSGYDKGIVSFIKSWYRQSYQEFSKRGLKEDALKQELLDSLGQIQLESISFENAVRGAFQALLEDRKDDFRNICQWLNGEGYLSKVHKPYGILEKIDNSSGARMLRSLAQWVKQIGYTGLVVLFDEGEKKMRMSTKDLERHLGNLRELVDECGHATFPSVMIFYSVPDMTFFQGGKIIYEALKQRLATTFETDNPSGTTINLENAIPDPESFMHEVGEKLLLKVYKVAYHDFDLPDKEHLIHTVAHEAFAKRFADISYRRLFVQTVIWAFNFQRFKRRSPSKDEVIKELERMVAPFKDTKAKQGE